MRRLLRCVPFHVVRKRARTRNHKGEVGMKLASYLSYGVATFGVVSGDGVVTLGGKLKGGYKTLTDAIAAGALDEIRKTAKGARTDQKLSDVRFLPVISNPSKIL